MQHMYVGCRTTKERNARGKGISVYRLDGDGGFTLQQIVEGLVNPSYLCFDVEKRFLYSVHGDFSEVSAFSVNSDSGDLTLLNTVSTEGVNPVHLSIDKTNRWLFVANLQTGNVVVVGRNDDGTLAGVVHSYTMDGLGEGDVSHPHQVAQDRTGDYLLVSCQGRKAGFGQVDVFRIDHETGALTRTCQVRSREIAEPRHLVVHPNNRWCYGVNEKDYSVTFYEFDAAAGSLEAKQILPTLPDTYTGDGWASGIIINPEGSHIVVSNRKHDSLTSFAIDEDSGRLALCDCIKTGGGQPRFITFDPKGATVLAANELSDTITMFNLDTSNGSFGSVEPVINTESPVCAIFD